MFICTSPNFLHAIPLFIWVTVNACCNKNRPKGLCLWTWPSWPLLHSWGLEGARPCSTYHVSKRSHSLSRLLRYKWNTYNNVCYFRLLIAKSSATHLWCHGDTLSWASYELRPKGWLSAHHSAICIQILSSLHTPLCFFFLPFLWCVYWKTVRVRMMLLDRALAISSSASHFDELCQGIEVDEQTNREGMAFPSAPKCFKRKLILRQTKCHTITYLSTVPPHLCLTNWHLHLFHEIKLEFASKL